MKTSSSRKPASPHLPEPDSKRDRPTGIKRYEEFAVGDTATFSKTIGEADILLFAAVSGDTYGLHVDEEYAKTTRFGRRVAHGMLTASLLSTVNALLLQRPGGVYVSQAVRFLRPVFIGDTVTARVEVVELLPAKRRMRCATTVVNQRGKIVIDGESIVQKDPA
jgi:3-hydroxybutyryl-CoA dehydratase